MIRNYLNVALRNLKRHKVYMLINTLSMGIAMACCMTAYLLVAYNLEFDDYFIDDKIKDIVKVMHHIEPSTGKQYQELVCPMSLAPQAAQEISGIESFTRFCRLNSIINYEGNAFHENVHFADPSFFEMFDLGLKKGTYKNFESQNSIFLSQKLAKKYFAGKNPIGEIITVELNNKKYEVVVGGVFKKLPLNISFNMDVLMHIETYLDTYSIPPNSWDLNHTSSVLLKLTDVSQRNTIAQQMRKYSELINTRQEEFRSISFELLPFKTPIINGEVNQSILHLRMPTIALIIFSTLGFIILLIACFNLANTTLALTGRRMKEIGVRKVMGSDRSQIVYQFLIEMVITVFLAVLAGLVMAQIIVPQFASMWQLQYGLNDLNKLNLIVVLIILLFVTAILAGIYPAWQNSKFKPIELLKGRNTTKKKSYFTRSLLVIQFSLSVIVFIAGSVFTQNAVFQENLWLGYDKESILTISIQEEQDFLRLKNSIANNPEIESIAGAANHIGPYTAYYNTVKIDTSLFKTNVYKVGTGYFNAVGLSVILGRDFKEGNQSDFESAVIIDENFAMNHQIINPIDAQIFYNKKPYRIIGVVKNHLSGLKQHENSEHLYTLVQPSDYKLMVIRTNPNIISIVRSNLEKKWKVLFPDKPFESALQEDIVYKEANIYNDNLKQIFFFITVFGCLLSTFGIFALASLNVQKRKREIGVRKVLGANVTSIVQLVNREFAIILSTSVLLGGFGGYFLTYILLNDLYVQHIDISFLTIILCGISIFIVGISTTSGTIFKAAITNPTKTLSND